VHIFKLLLSHYFADTYPDEWTAIKESFSPEQIITDTQDFTQGDIILPRYRTVPFGDLLEAEATSAGVRLINSYQQSLSVRDLYSWVNTLGDLTAPAHRIEDMDEVPEGSFFVKGQTSSLKNRGASAVFANSKAEALALAHAITQDDWISGEVPVIRPLQDYLRLGTTEKGLPIFHERRVFLYRGIPISEGFYWASWADKLDESLPEVDSDFWQAVATAAGRVSAVADFLVLDMAQYTDGHWGVVELNDGCQAGISGGRERELYTNLSKVTAFL